MSKKLKIYCIIGRALEILLGCSAVAGFWLWILHYAFFG